MDLDQLHRLASIIIVAGVIIALMLLYQDILWGADLVTQYPLSLEYYPAFLATSIGVLLALVLEEAITTSKRERRMKAMMKILEKEMRRISDNARTGELVHFDTQVWESMVNSGDVSFLTTQKQGQLFDIYAEAKRINDGIRRPRDDIPRYQNESTVDNVKTELLAAAVEQKLHLHEDIDNLLKSMSNISQ